MGASWNRSDRLRIALIYLMKDSQPTLSLSHSLINISSVLCSCLALCLIFLYNMISNGMYFFFLRAKCISFTSSTSLNWVKSCSSQKSEASYTDRLMGCLVCLVERTCEGLQIYKDLFYVKGLEKGLLNLLHQLWRKSA